MTKDSGLYDLTQIVCDNGAQQAELEGKIELQEALIVRCKAAIARATPGSLALRRATLVHDRAENEVHRLRIGVGPRKGGTV